MHTSRTLRARRAPLSLACVFLLILAACSSHPARKHTHGPEAVPASATAARAASSRRSRQGAPALVTTAAVPAVSAAAAAPVATPAAVTTPPAPVTPAEKPLPRPGAMLDRVVAVVNDEVILKS